TIRRFRETKDGVQLVVHTLPNQEVIDSVAAFRADVGLVLVPHQDAMILSQNFGAADLVCILPPGHALAALSAVKVTDLAGFPLISFGGQRPIGALVERAFAQAGR